MKFAAHTKRQLATTEDSTYSLNFSKSAQIYKGLELLTVPLMYL